MKTLNVQKITRKELAKQWGTCAWILPLGELFIRSNSKGFINYDKAPVYTWQEIQDVKKRRPVHFTVPQEIHEL